MTFPAEIQTRYDEALSEIAYSQISVTHPGHKDRIIDQIYAKNEELNRVRIHPEGRTKQDWLALIEKLKSELSALVAQDDQIVSDNHDVDIQYNQMVFESVEEKKRIPDNQWKAVRKVRNNLLSDCDWTQVSDAPLSDDKKNGWKQYRQDLRDIPDTYSSVESIVWPTHPE